MELTKRLVSTGNNVNYSSDKYQPQTYQDIDGWLNHLLLQNWLAIIGTYSVGGFANVAHHLRTKYEFTFIKWREKDLRHYLNSRTWSDFKSRFERM